MILSPDDLRRRVDALPWHHRIDLGNGVVTPGKDRSERKLADLRLPSLTGRSVLDVGAWDGYFSFAAERLGASRVMAVDSYAWSGEAWGSKDGFELARAALGSQVQDTYCEVGDIAPETVGGVYDVVLFLGVLYHMREPFRALERVASVTGDLLVIETLEDLVFTRRPALAFYPGDAMNGDPTNWFAPNTPALKAMLGELGFTRVEVVSRRSVPRRAALTARHVANVMHSRLSPDRENLNWNFLSTDRLIVHAHR